MKRLYTKSVWQDNICIKLDGSRKFGETAVIGESLENEAKDLEQ